MRLGRRTRQDGARHEHTDPCVADLVRALGEDRVRADGAARHLASADASMFSDGTAGPVCFPDSTEHVQQIMRVAASHDRAVLPRGAGSGLSGGAAPLGDPIVVSTTRMTGARSSCGGSCLLGATRCREP